MYHEYTFKTNLEVKTKDPSNWKTHMVLNCSNVDDFTFFKSFFEPEVYGKFISDKKEFHITAKGQTLHRLKSLKEEEEIRKIKRFKKSI